MDEFQTRTETDAAFDATRRLAVAQEILVPVPDPLAPDGVKMLLLPEGRTASALAIDILDRYRDRPVTPGVRGAVIVNDLQSFIAYCSAFRADTDSADVEGFDAIGRLVVFGRHDPLSLRAVLDHPEAHANPTFGRHTVEYQPIASDTWRAWLQIDGKEMDQGDFAEFLENHIGEVAHIPDDADAVQLDWRRKQEAQFGAALANPSVLMQVAAHLEVTVGRKLAGAPALHSGEVTMRFEEEHTSTTSAGVQVSIPKAFAISLPPYLNSPNYLVLARLRYRVNGGHVKWRIMLHRLDLVRQAVFQSTQQQVSDALGVTPLLGSTSIGAPANGAISGR